MALSEAEKRRKRFLKIKQNAGGSIDNVVSDTAKQSVFIYFTAAGDILSVSPGSPLPKAQVHKNSKVHEFTGEQAEIIKGKNTNLYRVRQDQFVDTVFTIESKPIEAVYVKSEDDFVSLIDFDDTDNYDVKVSVEGKKVTVSAHKAVVKKYKNIELNQATAKGNKLLKFYFTSVNDPHFLIYSFNVNLADLLEKNTVEVNVPANLTKSSIYTIKLFEKYIRA